MSKNKFSLNTISEIKEGQQIEVGLDVTVGKADVIALRLLSFLYTELGDDGTYAEAERILTEAIWWHVTINTMTSNDMFDGLGNG